MIYNKLSGSTINNYSDLFDRFNSNECFLAFAREENVWGELSLVNISLSLGKTITSLFGSTLFNDIKETGYNSDNRTVFVYRTTDDIADFAGTVGQFTKISRSELSQEPIYLEYMNSNWCQLKNLPPNYADLFPLTENGVSYKYYLFPQQQFYSINPDATNVTNKNYVKINLKSKFGTNNLNENVKLILEDPNTRQPIPVFENNYLTKTTTILGETFVIGLTQTVIDSGISKEVLLTYANNTPSGSTRNTKPYFYLMDSQGNVKSTRMYLQSYTDLYRNKHVYFVDQNQSKYLLFQNETLNSQNGTFEYYYSKITLEQTYDGLAIYNETLPFVYSEVDSPSNVTDSNPPALDINYLKTSTVSKSLFDVRGYMRIKNEGATREFRFCRQIVSSAQRAYYVSMGFGNVATPTRYFEDVEINSATPYIRYSNLVRPFVYDPLSTKWVFYLFNNTFLKGESITIRVPGLGNITREVLDSNFELNYIECYSAGAIPNIPKKLIEAVGFETADIFLTDAQNTIINKTEYAICEDYDDALEYLMDSVMIKKSIPSRNKPNEGIEGLYEGLYRSLAICYKPSIIVGGQKIPCGTEEDDNFDATTFELYNSTKKRYETGSVLYVANKTPIYRKYIANGVDEVFKIIV